ncbi:MAG TPA: M56 family metallopeptidase [Rhodanobacter sp.]
MDAFLGFADTLLARLAWTSAQAVLLIGVVWLAGRLLPKLPAAARSMLWWLLGVQLILGLTVAAPVKLPLLAAPSGVAAASTPTVNEVRVAVVPAASLATVSPPPGNSTPPIVSPWAATTAFVWVHWRPALIALWLAGVLIQLLLVARDWRKARAVLRNSSPLRDPALQALCAEQVHALGLRRAPELRVSDAIGSPQVMGLWRSTVLLPYDHNLTPQECSLALAHELTHLRRGDLWMSWIPAIAQRLFFFHPLVAWAVREYALSREAACDAQVLQQTGAMPQAYGHLLLRLGVAHPMSSGLAGASPSFQNLKRRLTMLQQIENLPRQRARGWLLIGAIALLGVLPYRVTANSANHVDVALAAQQDVPPPGAPLPPPPPPPPPNPPLPAPPPPPPPPHMHGLSAHHVSIDTRNGATDGFALIDGDSITVNGTDSDVSTVQQLRKGSEPILWFRRGSKAYVVRDSSYIQRAKAIYAPVSALGERQGELGGEQGRLGGLQGGLGARQGELGSRQGQLGAEQAKLAILQASLTGQSDDKHQAAVNAQQARIEAIEKDLSQKQDELAKQQDELAKQQDELGARQDALGKKQEQAITQADRQIGALIDEALAKGIAQTVSSR